MEIGEVEDLSMEKTDLLPDDENLERTIKQDLLNRNDKLFSLMRLLNSIDENFIISIDGDWGSGKTFFVRQLMFVSRNYDSLDCISDDNSKIINEFSKKHFIVYYNAWENDDHVSPLESIIYNVLNEYPEYKKDLLDNNFNNFKDILMNFIEVSSIGIIKKEDLKSLKSYEDLAESIVTLEEKKSYLQKLINSIISEKNRLLLVVDELDRCKPDYAVKLLETLKHFYDNKNITIIVSTNNSQLSHTICHFYGEGFDGYGYLNKIYDTIITLSSENLVKYANNYFNICSEMMDYPESMSVFLFEHYNFSYREINKYTSMYRIVHTSNYCDNAYLYKRFPAIFVFLPVAIALKIKDDELFNKFINGRGTDVINDIFMSSDFKKCSYLDEDWFKDIFKPNSDELIVNAITREYLNIFSGNLNTEKKSFIDAISLLDNNISEYD